MMPTVRAQRSASVIRRVPVRWARVG